MSYKNLKVVAILLTLLTVPPLYWAIKNFVYFTFIESPGIGGTANIGLGLLFFAILINIPTTILWLVVLFIKKKELVETNNNLLNQLLNKKPLHIIIFIVVFIAIVDIIHVIYPSDSRGKRNVSEAVLLLGFLKQNVEDFYEENQRVPDIAELEDMKGSSGRFVEKLTGNNPYYATLKTIGVYPQVSGKTLGWSFDTKTGQWDYCTHGTIDIRFKHHTCRKIHQSEK